MNTTDGSPFLKYLLLGLARSKHIRLLDEKDDSCCLRREKSNNFLSAAPTPGPAVTIDPPQFEKGVVWTRIKDHRKVVDMVHTMQDEANAGKQFGIQFDLALEEMTLDMFDDATKENFLNDTAASLGVNRDQAVRLNPR